MATYYVSNLGSNTAPYESWAAAATSIGTVAALIVAGDVILVDRDHQESSAGSNVTFAAPALVFCVDKDASDAPAKMHDGSGYLRATSTVSHGFIFAAGSENYLYGINLVHAGTGAQVLQVSTGSGASVVYENCRVAIENTSHSGWICFGANDHPGEVRLLNTDFVTAHPSNRMRVGRRVKITGGSWTIFGGGSAPLSAVSYDLVDPGGVTLEVEGSDWSSLGAAYLVGGANVSSCVLRLSQCRLGSDYRFIDPSSTPASLANAEIYVNDCASGDEQGLFAYANQLGSVVSDASVKYTGGVAGQSWKITTTALASLYSPFRTPWVSKYNASTGTPFTPRLEVLRDGSATAYNNDEVWGEFLAKATFGTPQSSFFSDRVVVRGTPAAQASGTDTWDGENATHWAGKVDAGSAITPREVGDLLARVCVGAPSSVVYVDPFIRT